MGQFNRLIRKGSIDACNRIDTRQGGQLNQPAGVEAPGGETPALLSLGSTLSAYARPATIARGLVVSIPNGSLCARGPFVVCACRRRRAFERGRACGYVSPQTTTPGWETLRPGALLETRRVGPTPPPSPAPAAIVCELRRRHTPNKSHCIAPRRARGGGGWVPGGRPPAVPPHLPPHPPHLLAPPLPTRVLLLAPTHTALRAHPRKRLAPRHTCEGGRAEEWGGGGRRGGDRGECTARPYHPVTAPSHKYNTAPPQRGGGGARLALQAAGGHAAALATLPSTTGAPQAGAGQ